LPLWAQIIGKCDGLDPDRARSFVSAKQQVLGWALFRSGFLPNAARPLGVVQNLRRFAGIWLRAFA